jgi:hypothetical protein
MEGRYRGLITRDLPVEQRKDTKTLSQDNQSPDSDLNSESPRQNVGPLDSDIQSS